LHINLWSPQEEKEFTLHINLWSPQEEKEFILICSFKIFHFFYENVTFNIPFENKDFQGLKNQNSDRFLL